MPAKRPAAPQITVLPPPEFIRRESHQKPGDVARAILRHGSRPVMVEKSLEQFIENVAMAEGSPARLKAIEALVEHIIGSLINGARIGDPQQAAILARTAFRATEGLRRIHGMHEESLKQVSRGAPGWPLLISPMNGWAGEQYVEAQLARLELGAARPERSGGYKATSSPEKPFVGLFHGYCERMLLALHDMREPEMQTLNDSAPEPIAWIKSAADLPAIPPRDKDRAAAWFNVGWDALVWAFDGAPWDDPQLAKASEARLLRGKETAQGALKTELKRSWMARFS